MARATASSLVRLIASFMKTMAISTANTELVSRKAAAPAIGALLNTQTLSS